MKHMSEKQLNKLITRCIEESGFIREQITPFTGSIEDQTIDNDYFRKVLFTGKHSQLVAMSLPVGEEIGDEVHKEDQFFRIEQGEAKFVFNEKNEFIARDGDAVIVPAGTYHNVVNIGEGYLKLYTIYSPSHHPPNTIHRTKKESEEMEKKGK